MTSLPQRLAAYTDACNRFDMDAVERMFAEDAVYASPGLPHEMRGRKTIMSAFRKYFAQHTDQVSEDMDVKVIDANTLENRWTLQSSESQRQGWQRIIFNEAGEITRIDVRDE